MSVWFCGDATIKRFNNIYRQQNKVTDIISIPFQVVKEGKKPPSMGGANELGDLLISMPYVSRYCKKEKIPLEKQIQTLLIHGVTHLLGYDHETDGQYKRMSKKEAYIAEMLQEANERGVKT